MGTAVSAPKSEPVLNSPLLNPVIYKNMVAAFRLANGNFPWPGLTPEWCVGIFGNASWLIPKTYQGPC